MDICPLRVVRDARFDSAGDGVLDAEAEVETGARVRKLGSNTSPARNETGKVPGVDWNNSCPKSQNSAANSNYEAANFLCPKHEPRRRSLASNFCRGYPSAATFLISVPTKLLV
jgi:hypothetical protein